MGGIWGLAMIGGRSCRRITPRTWTIFRPNALQLTVSYRIRDPKLSCSLGGAAWDLRIWSLHLTQRG